MKKMKANKLVERIVIALMLLFLPTLILVNGVTFGHGDDVSEYLNPRRQGRLVRKRPVVKPADNPVYIENCSECHLAYSANLLPDRSWEKLMSVEELEEHFGEYIFLEGEDRSQVLNYLLANSMDKAGTRFARKLNRSIPSRKTLLRIRDIPEIAEEHEEIPEKYTIYNAKVLSLSQCSACHQQVEKGIYDEDDVFIPYEKLVRQ